MVYLSRIYTKTGDDGGTSLGNGARVAKDHPRVEAYGAVDELNAVLGLLSVSCLADQTSPQASEPEAAKYNDEIRQFVMGVANDLFDLGADLCVPETPEEASDSRLRISAKQVERIERAIDELNAQLEPLNSFILRGGTQAAAWCHFACTVCRRAERRVALLASQETINPQILIYLNRLSDYLFVAARTLNDGGRGDVLWQPGATRES